MSRKPNKNTIKSEYRRERIQGEWDLDGRVSTAVEDLSGLDEPDGGHSWDRICVTEREYVSRERKKREWRWLAAAGVEWIHDAALHDLFVEEKGSITAVRLNLGLGD